MNEKYFAILTRKLSKKKRNKEVPVSAMIVKDNKIITICSNQKEKNKNALNHAEIICLIKTSKKLKKWHLEDCDLYVTLKPCTMCEAIIKQFRIKNVYYLVDKLPYKKDYNKTNFLKANICTLEDINIKMLHDFFQNKRKKKDNML